MAIISIYIPGKKTKDAKPASTYEELVDRLMGLLSKSATKDEVKHQPAGSPEGGQFVADPNGGGAKAEKPTSVVAKGVKKGVHELISSGHGFSISELKALTGAKLDQQIHNAFADLKKQGGLHFAKVGGVYKVIQGNGTVMPSIVAPTPAPKAPSPRPDLITPQEKAVKSLNMPTVPEEPMSHAEADKHYGATTKKAKQELSFGLYILDGEGTTSQVEEALLAFKKVKAESMAQWSTNITGTQKSPNAGLVQVFQADKILANDLSAILTEGGLNTDAAKAFADWKTNTKLEKMGKLAPTGVEQKPEPVKPAPPTPQMESAMAAPAGHAAAYSSLVPANHKPLTPEEVASGKFGSAIAKAKSLLSGEFDGGGVGNKKNVETKLNARLKDKPAFQALEEAYKKISNSQFSLAGKMISQWASSSGNGQAGSCALQIAARDAFSMPGHHVENKQLSALAAEGEDGVFNSAIQQWTGKKPNAEETKVFKQALRDFVHAQYAETQDFLKSKGITELHLARGVKHTEHKSGAAETVKLKLQPASSFSTNYATAKQFAGSAGSICMVKVPISQVLSTYGTGFGCTSEHEVVVLQHYGTKAVVIPSAAGGTASHATEYVKYGKGAKK
jgi:hypothetical protein